MHNLQTMNGWTDARVERAKQMWADGLSASQIAADLGGVSRNGVISKMHRLGIRVGAKRPSSATPRPLKPPRARPALAFRPSRLMEVPELLDIPVEQRKTLLQLNDKTCHWPVGDPAQADFFFCGGEAAIDRPYCAYHCRVAYQPFDRRRSDRHARFLERSA